MLPLIQEQLLVHVLVLLELLEKLIQLVDVNQDMFIGKKTELLKRIMFLLKIVFH